MASFSPSISGPGGYGAMGNNVKRRIRHLRDTAAAYPTQRANIEAIMRYYEGGGRLPVPGREVLYSFDGEAKMGSLNDFVNEHVARGTVGWYDVNVAQTMGNIFAV